MEQNQNRDYYSHFAEDRRSLGYSGESVSPASSSSTRGVVSVAIAFGAFTVAICLRATGIV